MKRVMQILVMISLLGFGMASVYASSNFYTPPSEFATESSGESGG